ncbi:uncharacterized protein LOC128391505 [Panonychus citri]|uniref:uncharacterized protein LOC128391505 n=1 Tax=Panonychus citri TaxID=50023 RepID=UPI002307953B|nr:uncharacterized protein LOC128391505 [Panonychus citri]
MQIGVAELAERFEPIYFWGGEPHQAVIVGIIDGRPFSTIYLDFVLIDYSLPATITANISITYFEHSVNASLCTTSGKFYCGDGQCLDQRFRCDGRVNCFGSKDEEDCQLNQSSQHWFLILLSISTVIMFLIISSALVWFGWTKIMIRRKIVTTVKSSKILD